MPMNINQHIITLNIHKTPDSDFFLVFFLSFELKVRVFDEVYALILHSAIVFPALGFWKKILIGYHLFVHNNHV